jgi:putative endonuclease
MMSEDRTAQRSPMSTRERGTRGESLAAEFLEMNGIRVLARNYRYQRGEIDLIALDGDELVFVEVKTRRTTAYGEPEEAVTPKKQAQLRSVAEGYLLEHDIEGGSCRFDVVTVMIRHDGHTIRLHKDAF